MTAPATPRYRHARVGGCVSAVVKQRADGCTLLRSTEPLGDYPRAMGNIHTIAAAYFPNSFYPEAQILKAVIYFKYCLYDQAEEAIAGALIFA